MNAVLLDTNVLSELTKPVPAVSVQRFLRDSRDRVYLSVMSVGEIRKGISCLPSGRRQLELSHWLDSEILPWFSTRILPVTLPIAMKWGEIGAELKAKGSPRPVVDSLLAATAIVHNLYLV